MKCLFNAVAFAVLFSSTVWAFERSVVKLISFNEPQSRKFVGSGLAISEGGDWATVLTSDHVVFHSNSVGFSHRLLSEAGVSVPAEYVVSDSGHGLALLRVKAQDLATAGIQPLARSQWIAAPPMQSGDEALFVGFPAASQSLFSVPANFLQQAPGPTFLPEDDGMLEFSGYAEFGMSGGPAFHANGECVGVLTYRAPSQVGLVSCATAMAWWDAAVKGTVRPALFESAWNQKAETDPNLKYRFLYTRGLVLNFKLDGLDVVSLDVTPEDPGLSRLDSPSGDFERVAKALAAYGVEKPLRVYGADAVGFLDLSVKPGSVGWTQKRQLIRPTSFPEFVKMLKTGRVVVRVIPKINRGPSDPSLDEALYDFGTEWFPKLVSLEAEIRTRFPSARRQPLWELTTIVETFTRKTQTWGPLDLTREWMVWTPRDFADLADRNVYPDFWKPLEAQASDLAVRVDAVMKLVAARIQERTL